jgi:ubiquinone biosynthesis protein
MKLSTLTQFSNNAQRFKDIITVLAKYGLARWIDENDPEFIRRLLQNSDGVNITDMSQAVRIRMALTELGTTFIKLGQILSTRADLVGPEIVKELTKLQSDIPADSEEVVRQTVESELGKPVEELFAEFDFIPLGSASIGQVHKAKLHTGETVVVKVQHEGIEPKIINDLEILKTVAGLAERYDTDLEVYQPTATINDFSRSLLRELDFQREVRSLNSFGQNFAKNPSIHIPQPFPTLCSKRVITMEMLEGFSIGDTKKMKESKIDRKEFVRTGATMYLEMVFRDRFFHGDPHPGNIWVLPGGKIGLLDCGMTGRIDNEMREELEGMLLSAVDNDPGRLTEHVLNIASVPQTLDRDALRRDIDDFLSENVNVDISALDLSSCLTNLTDILRDYHIIFPSGISALLRVLIMLEGTSRLLDSNFNLAELIQPYAIQSIQRRYSPKKLVRQAQHSLRDWDRLNKILPKELFEILTQVRQGNFGISIQHHRLENVIKWLVRGMLIAALFMGGSTVLSQAIPPLIKGVSAIGMTSCLMGIVLGYHLLNDMKNSDNS